ncbi:MAG TPA: peroxiredoxin-like family protein [Caulobacteraceae bacterium]|jgi:peroxiredoxin|nr:peroxiredoxin-like family protein [Caulobacteraceae bacterium]
MDDSSHPPANPFAALEVALQQAREMNAPLNARMQVIADAVRTLSGEFAEAVDVFVARLQAAGAGAGAPQIGEPMPPFLLPDETGRLVSLKSLLGRGPIVIAFHRGHWCPYCRLNAFALVEAQPRLGGAQVVAITPELQKHTLDLKAEAGADFPILSDMDNGYALSANLAIWVDDAMAGMIDAAGWNIPSYNGAESWILPIPATFVLDSDGIITARDIDPDYRRRMDLDALVEAVGRTR